MSFRQIQKLQPNNFGSSWNGKKASQGIVRSHGTNMLTTSRFHESGRNVKVGYSTVTDKINNVVHIRQPLLVKDYKIGLKKDRIREALIQKLHNLSKIRSVSWNCTLLEENSCSWLGMVSITLEAFSQEHSLIPLKAKLVIQTLFFAETWLLE